MYARNVDGRELTFGVSGMLFRANVLMYDHQSESLWLQVKHSAVTGPMTGKKLKILPSTFTTWGKWLKKHPDTEVLTTQTGSGALYQIDTRLRPSGRSGLLVTSIEAFERYQEENAWTWEHQALLRSRAVAGSSIVASSPPTRAEML